MPEPRQTTKPESQFMTPQQVSDRYDGNITVRTLSNWRNLGSGPPFSKIGGRVLYPADKLLEWEQRNTVQSTSQYRGNTK